MKKILLATSALVATAGIAAAEVSDGVSISGNAEMGVVAGSRYGDTTQFYTSSDIDFKLRGEADNGLTFGADFDLDEASSLSSKTAVFIAFGAAKLTMGDTDGAFDWALQEIALAGGSIDDSETEHPGYSGNGTFDGSYDGQIARFEYSFGDFAAALSTEIDDTGTNDPVIGVGFKYSGDLGGTTLGVGVAYVQRDESAFAMDEAYGISIDAGLASGVKFAVNYQQGTDTTSGSTADDVSYVGVGVGYEMNALAIGLNYGEWDNYDKINDAVGNAAESSGFGLAVAYDLGGGLAVQFGAGVGEYTTTAGVETDWDSYSLGLSMKF